MSKYLNYYSFYFFLPILISSVSALLIFNIPTYFTFPLCFLALLFSPLLLVDLLRIKNNNLELALEALVNKRNFAHGLVALGFSSLVLFFCIIDLKINGIKLLTPSTYAELNGFGKYVRNISTLCWVFVPISFYYLKSPKLKFIFIASAIIFPILFVDRNRLLMSAFCLIFCMIFSGRMNRRTLVLGIGMCILSVFCVFIIVGLYRSGSNAFIVPSSQHMLLEGQYPLKPWFGQLNVGLQQLLIYIASPIFNFATVVSSHYYNSDFLIQQLSPFSRTVFYPDSPALVARFNVGTEFYPFAMYGGLLYVLYAGLVMMLSFALSLLLLKYKPNIFTLMIFLRVAYTVLLMGFAPQFFILTNLACIILIALTWATASLLNFTLNNQVPVGIKA